MNPDVGESARARQFSQGTYKVARSFKSDHFARRPDNFGQIGRGVSGSGANVEHPFADRDAGFLPAAQSHRPPDAMLESKPGQFLLMSAKNVIALNSHWVIVVNRRIFAN